jgi:hypothetical protein
MTTLDLFNKALAAIGRKRFLSNVNSAFAEAVHCRREWDAARQAVLSAHEWGWLAQEMPLCQGTESTSSDGGVTVFLYPRPPAALRITAVMEETGKAVKWAAVNGQIQATVEAAIIRYLPDSDTPDDWPSAVQDAMVFELASRIAIPLEKNPNMLKGMKQLALAALATATGRDSSEVRYDGDTGNRYVNARR